MEDAAAGLDEAIKAFTAVARSKNPPYPPQDIDQRAAMGRNSLAGQLARAIEAQRTYESTNAAKLAGARARREAEMKKKEEEELRKQEQIEERQRTLAEERRKLVEESRVLARRRMVEEEARRGVDGYDSEDGGKRKRKSGGGGRKGRKGKGREDGLIETSESERELGDAGAESSAPRRRRRSKSRTLAEDGEDTTAADRPKKRKRLTKSGGSAAASGKKGGYGKYKSAETVDSDEDLDDEEMTQPLPTTQEAKGEDEGEDAGGKKTKGRRKPRVEDDSDDEPLEEFDPEFVEKMERDIGKKQDGEGDVPIDPALRDNDVEMEDN